jgi:L-threonylcarbamoyladenylate synthase
VDSVAQKLAKDSAIGVIPTDTVYGIVARTNDPKAIGRVYKLKQRSLPGTILAANIDQLVQMGLKRRYLVAVSQFWPGPVSVELPCVDEKISYLHLGTNKLAVRIPKDEKLIELLNKTGPLMTTSANHPGKETAHTIAEAKSYFGDKVDFYLDGGELNNKPSAVIRVIDDEVEVIRDGDIKVN